MATFPERAIAALNAVLTPVADAALAPLISRAPLLLLAVVSALTALAMLFVVRRTSNQAALAAAKRGIRAALFEVRLFHDEPRGVWPALGRMLAANARYLRHTLVPFLWMVLPLTLVVAQLQAFYGYEGLRPGRAVVLRAELRDTRAAASDQMRLTTSAGLQADAEPVRLRGGRELVWRVTPLEAGRHTATLHDGDSGTDLVITLDASSGLVRRSPVRGSAWDDLLLYPSDQPLPEAHAARRLSVAYPEPGLAVAGTRVPWLVAYVLLSMALAFGLARRFGVVL